MVLHHSKKVKPLPPFIAWDGEGAQLRGEGQKQSYVLFGCATGPNTNEYITLEPGDMTLESIRMLDFMLDIRRRYPTSKHVGFAFGYDSNMIVQTLSTSFLERLHRSGNGYLRLEDGTKYRIEYRPSKWLRVSRERPDGKKESICIEDLFSFFGTSFIKAYESLCGPISQVVKSGKALRGNFRIDDFDTIVTYWKEEIELLRQLAESFRDNLYSAGLTVTRFYGPGAVASHILKREGIKHHKDPEPNDKVIECARYAYAGGRFELFKVGRTVAPIYAVDINSAYPFAISRLPSLAHGEWREVSGCPTTPDSFSMHHVRIHAAPGRHFFREPGALFHRDKDGFISYPWSLEGWYWGPEVWNVKDDPRVEILEGWKFVKHAGSHNHRPFYWVEDMYKQRLEWKRQGNPSQLALKLALNSLYGKMAQRVGWNQSLGKPPAWHQLEWAGWVTSMTRASLYRLIHQLEPGSLISCETDAVYTTDPMVTSHITVGDGLGEWGLDVYDEIVYLQSGLAWLRKGEKWEAKRRGLDHDSFTLQSCMDYVKRLSPSNRWVPFTGNTTRFIGLGTAIASSIPTKVHHCRWLTSERIISVGDIGKRGHNVRLCDACRQNLTAYEGLHDMHIKSNAYKNPMSFPHEIPWADWDPLIHAEELEHGTEHFG